MVRGRPAYAEASAGKSGWEKITCDGGVRGGVSAPPFFYDIIGSNGTFREGFHGG